MADSTSPLSAGRPAPGLTHSWDEALNKSFSIYLDLVRFTAACLVYLWHSNQRAIVEANVPFSGYGHSAVVVFFVLSGFVIAYVVDTKETDVRRYAAGRLARIYSVVVPTLAITLILDTVGRALAPTLYLFPFDHFALRLIASLLMLNEVWFVSITAFSNAPYWSVAYECWYYVLFGLAMFTPSRWRWPLLLVLALALGPKVVLLAPIWLSGVWLYRWHWPTKLSLSAAGCLFVLSSAGIVAVHATDFLVISASLFRSVAGEWLFTQLAYSKYFLGDYVLCLLVWCNFAGMRILAESVPQFFRWIERPVRAAAGLTFTLYLLHQPVLLFWAAVIRGDPARWANWWAVTALTALTIICVSAYTEQNRHVLKLAIEKWLSGWPSKKDILANANRH